MTLNVVTQNPRDFTVQIRSAEGAIVGTGIAVSMAGQVVTCRHVVEAALGHKAIANEQVTVYFPQVRGDEEKKRTATVVRWFEGADDDVVMLQLEGGPAPLGPEQIAVLGAADDSERHPFRAYGYRPLPPFTGGWADGVIQGSVEVPEAWRVQVEPIQLDCNQINQGMSGAGVLDTERNLVVGIVSAAWLWEYQEKKDLNTAWAVNARVLSLAPLGLRLHPAPLARKPAPTPKYDTAQAEAAVAPHTRLAGNPPATLPEWVGRTELLAALTADWHSAQTRVVGLIGFGGEGKSSLARQWIETILADKSSLPHTGETVSVFKTDAVSTSHLETPDGVFWWGFYENRSVDEFLEAALNYLSGGRIDPRQIQSSSVRAQIIGAMLNAGRYVFVLDGVEVLQHQDSGPSADRYGLLQSPALRELLSYFARPAHRSFCLLTSRAPLLDLLPYTTYAHREVERLSLNDGTTLLRNSGVTGTPAQLEKIVAAWNAHALTLSLVASFLVKQHSGNAAFADALRLEDETIEATAPAQYQHIRRILRRYDENLTDAERKLLKLFSLFRAPVHESALNKVFAPLLASSLKDTMPPSPERGGAGGEVETIFHRLTQYRLLRYDAPTHTYTTHPLIRTHYFALFARNERSDVSVATHTRIKDYYLALAGNTLDYPTLDDLKPLIEVVHHACEAGAYDEAWEIYWESISQKARYVLTHQLGAYEIELSIMENFFPDGDITREPLVSNAGDRRFTLNSIGLCLMSLGRLREAVPFCERATNSCVIFEKWRNAGVGYVNLTELYIALGTLVASAQAVQEAVTLARRVENVGDECQSLATQAWVVHLRGDMSAAEIAFAEAAVLEQIANSSVKYLYSNRGVYHANHLCRIGQPALARCVAEANLQICEKNHFIKSISQCHRILGDLDADVGQHLYARTHYDTALKIARSISYRPALIEALLARGRYLARNATSAQDPARSDAYNDLTEALGYCLESGYRLYEVDARVGLAWLGGEQARAEAQRALQLSEEMGYHWGKVDAEEVLRALGS